MTKPDEKTLNGVTLKSDGRVFIRHAVTLGQEPVSWLVGELDGVRVYVTPDGIRLTKEDLYP